MTEEGSQTHPPRAGTPAGRFHPEYTMQTRPTAASVLSASLAILGGMSPDFHPSRLYKTSFNKRSGKKRGKKRGGVPISREAVEAMRKLRGKARTR